MKKLLVLFLSAVAAFSAVFALTAKPSEGLLYELTEDNSGYIVIGIGKCKDVNLVIPSIYNALPVVEVGYEAFDGCDSLTSVTYNGTKAQWQSINKSDDWSNDSEIKTIKCTGGNIAL